MRPEAGYILLYILGRKAMTLCSLHVDGASTRERF